MAQSRHRRTSLLATTLVAALLGTLITVATATAATAASHRGFRAPTEVTPVAVRCIEIGENAWKVRVRFRVRGGRYANLGGTQRTRALRGDNVYRGGRRFVVTTERWFGFPGDPAQGTTATVRFDQVIAPIGRSRDVTAWRLLHQEHTVTVRCA